MLEEKSSIQFIFQQPGAVDVDGFLLRVNS
jgi:hypothetical protein